MKLNSDQLSIWIWTNEEEEVYKVTVQTYQAILLLAIRKS